MLQSNQKKPILITSKETNVPRDYIVITRLKNGNVIAIRDYFSLLANEKRSEDKSD